MPDFTPSEFCTPWCGKSQFPDWLHTPKCEADFEEAYEAELREERMSPFERRRRAGQLPVKAVSSSSFENGR